MLGALITGGASLIGGLGGAAMSMEGVNATNAANEQMNQANIDAALQRQSWSQDYNSTQASIARDFSAQQVQQQEQFQQQQMVEAENYNTNMSDTAMQRRVTDLKDAGINPLLAVSQGGASTPTISGMQGAAANASQASAGIGGQGSSIPMQNPMGAFGNLGGIVNSALEASKTQANIDLLKSQTDKTNMEAGIQIPANAEYLKSMTGLSDQNAKTAYYQALYLQEQIYGQRLSNDNLRDVITPTGQQNLQVLKATRDALISASQSDAAAKNLGLQQLRNMNDVQQGNFGKVITYMNAILQPLHTATGAIGNVR